MPLPRKRARTAAPLAHVKVTVTPSQANDLSDDDSSDQTYESSSASPSCESQSDDSETASLVSEKNLTANDRVKDELLGDGVFLSAFKKKLEEQIDPSPKRFENSVVDICVDYKMDDHSNPWLGKTTGRCSGSGFILKYNGEIVLVTNAHVAEMAAFLTVRLADEAKKYTAKIRVLDHSCDLAILDVADDNFWHEVEPLTLGEMPSMRSAIVAAGFPRLGNELCLTPGHVSRVEVSSCVNGDTQILQFQVTAPINPGNSGGPVINPLNEVVGVAFQGSDGDGEGFVITPQIIRHFLDDALHPDRPYQGFAELAFQFQPMQNKYMKQYYGITGENGVVLMKPDKLSGLRGLVQPYDILLALDGVPIRDDATVSTPFAKRVHFDYLLSRIQIGQSIRATIMRDGEFLEIDLPLLFRNKTTTLGGNFLHDAPPSYLIVSGVVLQTLTPSLVDEKGNGVLEATMRKAKRSLGEAKVVIAHIFQNEYTKAYEVYTQDDLQMVTHINGTKIHNLHHALAVLEENTGEFHVLQTKQKYRIPVKRISKEENLKLLHEFGVTKDRSDDLLAPPVYAPGCPEYAAQQTATPTLRA